MKFKIIFLLVTLVATSGFQALSQTSEPAENQTNRIPATVSWEAQKEHDKWRKLQDAIDLAEEIDRKKTVDFRIKVEDQAKQANETRREIENLREKLLAPKKLTPKDPWREVYSEKRYAMSADSHFVKFRGQILEVVNNGIRVLGSIDDSTEASEYYVINFPYEVKAGESIDSTKIYMAFEDGRFSYVTEDGYAKTVPKLNYGKPCSRPQNGEEIEAASRLLTPQETSQISRLELKLKGLEEIIDASKKSWVEYSDGVKAVRKAAIEELALAKEIAVKSDFEKAEKGDLAGLQRMGERYRDGDGVETNLNKSVEYYKKAESAADTEANRLAEVSRIKEQEVQKLKFLRNLELADKHDNVESALYIEKCYRDGIGTEKDLNKAAEYHAKAISLGIPTKPNRLF